MRWVSRPRRRIRASDHWSCFARAIRPVHTPFDGDIVFALSTAKRPLEGNRPREIMRLGHLAADCIARSIARGVYEAKTLGTAKSYRDTFS